MKQRYIILSLSFLTLSLPLAAQDDDSEQPEAPRKEKVAIRKHYPTRQVRGRVVDATTKTPLAGALVRVSGGL